jgi:hypothetical protein
MPVLLKGLTVAAVVATTGGAAAEINHVSKPDSPAPKAQAVRHATATLSPTAPALKPAPTRLPSTSSTHRAHFAKVRFTNTTARTRGVGAIVPRAQATLPLPVAAAPAPVPTLAPTQQQPVAVSAPAVTKTPVQTVKAKLTDLRQQVLDAVSQAQATAASGAAGALDLATKTLESTIGSLRPTIERLLASVGLKLPTTVSAPSSSTPTATTTSSSPSLPELVLAPVQQVLSGVDSLLSQLFGRSRG